MSDPHVVRIETVNRVRILSFNRPEKRNAINDAVSAALLAAVDAATADPNVGAIVLRGEGPSFSSGRDTTEMGRNVQGRGFVAVQQHAQALNRAIRGCAKPIVAALKGHVIGKALETALSADVRVAATDARLAFP